MPELRVFSSLPLLARVRSQSPSARRTLQISDGSLFILALTLGTIAADQFIAPVLFSSSPLWASLVSLLLVWRRGSRLKHVTDGEAPGLSLLRVGLFVALHAGLVSLALVLPVGLAAANGTLSSTGWIIAGLKLSVFGPTLVLLSWSQWRTLSRIYLPEGAAALIVLLTFFPERLINAAWPWYGQALGKTVFYLSGIFVPGLSYTDGVSPVVHGPQLDVNILLACSGISGLELFDYLFAFVALLGWNILHKRRTFLAYLAGIAVMLLGNVVRIVSFVVLGNSGFAEGVSRYHLSAGWLFFSMLFIAYLSLIYRRILSMQRISLTSELVKKTPAAAEG